MNEQVPSKESFSWPTSKGDPIGPVWSYGGKKGMYQDEALRAFAHDLVDRIKEFEMPVREAMKAARGDGLDAFAYCRLLQRKNDNLLRALNYKQAKIDALMLEFCPGEMSAEQRAEYAKAQQPTHEPCEGVKCVHCNGSGEETQHYDEQNGWSEEKPCDTCKGSGRITTVDQYLKTVKANWHEDSSLETWFPITAQELKCLQDERASQPPAVIPPILFDGTAVWQEAKKIRTPIDPMVVSDVLDAVVRLMLATATKGANDAG